MGGQKSVSHRSSRGSSPAAERRAAIKPNAVRLEQAHHSSIPHARKKISAASNSFKRATTYTTPGSKKAMLAELADRAHRVPFNNPTGLSSITKGGPLMWTCASCTLQNEEKLNSCGMCYTPRGNTF